MLEDRTYPVDIDVEQKPIHIQIGRLGHKVWLYVPEQSIVRIANAQCVTIEDLRESKTPKGVITLDLRECPHMRVLKHWASVSHSLNMAERVLVDLTLEYISNDCELTDDQQIVLEDLEALEPALNWLHKAVQNKLKEQEEE